MIKAIGYANNSSHGKLKPFEFERNEPQGNEVQIDVLFCGVCHSDIHQARNEWHNTLYPCLPGHEIVGKIVGLGAQSTKFKVGDLVGVGCMVDSCHVCENCKNGLENYCDRGFLGTYNGNVREPKEETGHTYGGYSNTMVVREDFVLRIPNNLSPADAAPIMCAGVTTYSPLRHWGVKKGTKVGVIGLGGLGHVAVKLAVAMGAEVTVITTTEEKNRNAKKLGAIKVILSTDKDQMKANERTLDLILSTIPVSHDVNPYTELLKTNGTLTIVGCLTPLKAPLNMSKMNIDRKSIGSTLIGGIAETQEALDFCSQMNVKPDIQVVNIDVINEVFDTINEKKADFRYVIDMKSLEGKKEDKGILEKIGL